METEAWEEEVTDLQVGPRADPDFVLLAEVGPEAPGVVSPLPRWQTPDWCPGLHQHLPGGPEGMEIDSSHSHMSAGVGAPQEESLPIAQVPCK